MADSNSHGPLYYRRGSVQIWDFIRDQGLNFHLGNAIKYICRAGFKDDRIADLRKAIHYLQNELEQEILLHPSGRSVPPSVQSQERQSSAHSDYAADFDR